MKTFILHLISLKAVDQKLFQKLELIKFELQHVSYINSILKFALPNSQRTSSRHKALIILSTSQNRMHFTPEKKFSLRSSLIISWHSFSFQVDEENIIQQRLIEKKGGVFSSKIGLELRLRDVHFDQVDRSVNFSSLPFTFRVKDSKGF